MKTINKIRSKDPDIYNAEKEWFDKAGDETDDDDDDEDGGEGGVGDDECLVTGFVLQAFGVVMKGES